MGRSDSGKGGYGEVRDGKGGCGEVRDRKGVGRRPEMGMMTRRLTTISTFTNFEPVQLLVWVTRYV